MKQYITVDQLNELSKKGRKKLRKWWKPKEWDPYIDEEGLENVVWCCEKDVDKSDMPLLSIGQMIEFLDDKTKYTFSIFRRHLDWKIVYENKQYGKIIPGELCDFLWEACKDILNG